MTALPQIEPRPPTAPREKIWGFTQPLIITPMFELHRLTIKPWHRCSLHKHQFKHNAFYVISGVLYVDTLLGDFNEPKPTRIDTGNTFTVAPALHHQFRTGPSPCIALEMYYTEPLSEDIIRRNEGGPI
jgi:mannose-6-phosphate isomerase-like protein (cupin superfamily)